MCKEIKVKLSGFKRPIKVDKCIVPLVKALNRLGIKTMASCCGHGDKEKFYISISKNSFVNADTPFYRPENDIILINKKKVLVPKGMRCVDGLFLVNRGVKVTKVS